MGLATEALKKNKNYRRYASSVERALSLFDSALQEWADYISFLSRLLKVVIERLNAHCNCYTRLRWDGANGFLCRRCNLTRPISPSSPTR